MFLAQHKFHLKLLGINKMTVVRLFVASNPPPQSQIINIQCIRKKHTLLIHRHAHGTKKSASLLAVDKGKQESPANAKGRRDSSACMKAHCEQM